MVKVERIDTSIHLSLRIHVHIRICIDACILIYTYTYTYTRAHIHIHTHTHTHTYVCTHTTHTRHQYIRFSDLHAHEQARRDARQVLEKRWAPHVREGGEGLGLQPRVHYGQLECGGRDGDGDGDMVMVMVMVTRRV